MNAATKHIAAAYYTQHDYVEQSFVTISNVPSSEMVADAMKKGFTKYKLRTVREMM